MDERAGGPEKAVPSYFRLDESAKQANMEWISRITDQVKKRKANTILPEIENPPANKNRKLSKRESPEIITIQDDSSLVHPQSAVNHADRCESNHEARIGRIQDNEQMEDIRNIIENLRDQVTDWTLRVQQGEASLEALLAKAGDPPGTAWQEDLRTKEIDPLIERIEKLENSRAGYHYAQHQSSSTSDTLNVVFKSSTNQLDKKLDNFSLTTSGNEVEGDDCTTAHFKSSSSEKAEVQSAMLSEIGISLGDASWGPPTLSNRGLKKLLQKVDFRNIEHLKALNTLDDRTTSRDCILFSDFQTFATCQVDYILRTGTTATYVQGPGMIKGDQTMKHDNRGLGELRIHRLDINYYPDKPQDKHRFKEWKREKSPPKYVYDLGQLFVRRRTREKHDLYGSQYNLMMDITKPSKTIWLVMRPERVPIVSVKKDRRRMSDVPFSQLLNGVGIAKLADTFGELELCQSAFDEESVLLFLKAEKSIANTSFKGRLTFQFSAPNIERMKVKVMAGWEGTRVQ